MKIILDVKELQSKLKNMSKVKKDVETINSENIIFKAVNNKTYLIKDNGWTRLSEEIESNVIEEGIISLGEKTIKIISKLPNNEIEINDECIKSGSKSIKYKNKNYIKDLNLGDCKEKFSVSQNELLRLLEVNYCIAQDETRQILCGVNIKNNKLCALDGYRMSVRSSSEFNIQSNITINSQSISILKSLLKNNNDIVEAEIYADYILFKFNKITIRCKYLEGNYIKYESLIPQNTEEMTTIQVDNIKEISKSLNILKDIKTNTYAIIKLNKNKNNQLILNANDEDNFISDVMEESKYNRFNINGDSEIYFNCIYLSDMAKVLKDKETLYMSFASNHSPMIIYEEDNLDNLDLILPIRPIR